MIGGLDERAETDSAASDEGPGAGAIPSAAAGTLAHTGHAPVAEAENRRCRPAAAVRVMPILPILRIGRRRKVLLSARLHTAPARAGFDRLLTYSRTTRAIVRVCVCV